MPQHSCRYRFLKQHLIGRFGAFPRHSAALVRRNRVSAFHSDLAAAAAAVGHSAAELSKKAFGTAMIARDRFCQETALIIEPALAGKKCLRLPTLLDVNRMIRRAFFLGHAIAAGLKYRRSAHPDTVSHRHSEFLCVVSQNILTWNLIGLANQTDTFLAPAKLISTPPYFCR